MRYTITCSNPDGSTTTTFRATLNAAARLAWEWARLCPDSVVTVERDGRTVAV